MRSLPTPNYVLMEDTKVILAIDSVVLPAGSFVRPINIYYLPAHIKANVRLYPVDLNKFVFCYTHYGITAVPISRIRKVS
jgi:hypothetical protein